MKVPKKERKKEQFWNAKRCRRPLTTTKLNDQRIFSLIKKTPIPVKKAGVGVSLSKSTLKRHLVKFKYHLSIHSLSSAYLGVGLVGISLSRETQTNLPPPTSFSLSGWKRRCFQERYNLSSVSCIYPTSPNSTRLEYLTQEAPSRNSSQMPKSPQLANCDVEHPLCKGEAGLWRQIFLHTVIHKCVQSTSTFS